MTQMFLFFYVTGSLLGFQGFQVSGGLSTWGLGQPLETKMLNC